METIKSPDEVSLLMENMWLRHKAGMKQRPNNKYGGVAASNGGRIG